MAHTLTGTTRLKQSLQQHALPRFATSVKQGELGGDGRDMSFEQAFSNLAHAYIRDKAPSLLDYEVGFQLVDRNQDNTKAIGVIGFKVGTQLVYVPAFWLNGDLKGHELLYLKNQDLFVPLKENWLNYITNRKPDVLGESTDRNTSMLGVLRPDLDRISNSPNKFAEAMDQVLPVMAHIATTPPEKWAKFEKLATFDSFIKEQDLDTIRFLVKAAHKHPVIATAIDRFYGIGVLEDAIKQAKHRQQHGRSVLDPSWAPKQAAAEKQIGGSVLGSMTNPVKRGALDVITYDRTTQDEVPGGLDEEDAEKLLQDGYLVRDRREVEEVAVPYNVQVEERLQNPHETGIYEVLTGVGNIEKCLVVVNPHGPHGRKSFCTVVRLDGEKGWLNVPPNQVWVVSQTITSPETWVDDRDFREFWEDLPNAESLPDDGKRHMFVGPRGDATVPLKHDKTYRNEDDAEIFEIECSDVMDYAYGDSDLYPTGRGGPFDEYSRNGGYNSNRHGCRLHIDSKIGTRMRSNMGDLYIPTGYKMLTVEADVGDKNEDDEATHFGPDGRSRNKPIRIGNMVNRQLGLVMHTEGGNGHTTTTSAKTGPDGGGDGDSVLDREEQDDNPKHTPVKKEPDREKESFTLGTPDQARKAVTEKLSRLTVWGDGVEVEVNRHRMSPKQALLHLVRDHGLREKAAAKMIKVASKPGGGKASWYIKYPDYIKQAISPYLSDSQPQSVPFPPPETGTDPFMGSRVPTMFQQEEAQVVPSLSGQTDREIYNPNPDRDKTPMDMANAAAGAAASGQREIFDTAMIGSMLKTVRDDSMVDRYLGDLMKGLDRLGRILFMFYWHGDAFKERYGKQDMPELEDSLRNAFEQVGDVVIFLREKTVEPFPDEGGFDISDAAET